MATLKRKKEDGTWEYVEVIGANVVNRLTVVELISSDNTQQIKDVKQHTTIKSNKDSNGISTTVTLKRSDGTIYMASVLSGGTSPQYTTRTETYYMADGVTVSATKTYARTYDSDGDLASEVIQ